MMTGVRETALLWSLLWPAATGVVVTCLQTALVVLAAGFVSGLLRQRTAESRRLVWAGSVVIVVGLGCIGAATAIRHGLTPEPSWLPADSGGPPLVATFARNILWIWFVPTLVLLLRFGWHHLRNRVWLADCAPLTAGPWQRDLTRIATRNRLGGPIALVVSRTLDFPLTTGVLRPRIVLPESFVDAPPSLRESVLWHELAHIRRHDVAYRWLSAFSCALCWFQPWVWFAASRLRRECEFASDDAVLDGADVTSATYARHLVAVAETTALQAVPLGAVGMGASELRARVEAIAEQRERRGLGRWGRVGLTLAAVALSLAVFQVQAPRPRTMFLSAPMAPDGNTTATPQSWTAAPVFVKGP